MQTDNAKIPRSRLLREPVDPEGTVKHETAVVRGKANVPKAPVVPKARPATSWIAVRKRPISRTEAKSRSPPRCKMKSADSVVEYTVDDVIADHAARSDAIAI